MNFPRNIPFRVLYLDHTARLGGGEIALFNLVTNIQTDRCTPIVVLGETGPLQQRLVAAGIETHVLPLAHGVADVRKDSLGAGVLLRFGDILHAIAYCIRLRRFILERHIDLVHTNSLKSDLLGGVAARLAGRPVIWHIRDRIADDYLPARTASTFRWLASWLPTHVIANSQSTLRTLDPGVSRRTFHSPFSTNHPLPVGGTVVYSGTTESTRDSVVHDGTFSGNPVQRGGTTNLAAPAPTEGHLGSELMTDSNSELSSIQELSTSPALSASNFQLSTTVGLVGRISPWKGQHIFILAAAEVHRAYPHTRFRIIGSPLFGEAAYDEEIRALVRTLQLDEVVEFTGFRTDVADLIAGMDIFVHASTTGEPFGQVIIEAMAEGKPVVATNGGGVPEIVIDGQTGILVTMSDAGAMAHAIVTLLSNPAQAQEMGRRGKERVDAYFTIERTARQVEEIYDLVLGRQLKVES